MDKDREAEIRQAARKFFEEELKPFLDSGSHKCPVCDRSNCRGNTECIQCGAPMPTTSQNTGPNAWHKRNRQPLQ